MNPTQGVFGFPPADLAAAPAGAVQLSPLIPGASQWENLPPLSLREIVLLAPAGTTERQYALAQALLRLEEGGSLTALAPKDKGGSRLAKELRSLGMEVEEEGKSHHRICRGTRPPELPASVQEAIAAGSPLFLPELQLHTQPGVFSWNRIDAGSQLLLGRLPEFIGLGADLGCGLGVLARQILRSAKVRSLHLLDIDRRAIACAQENVSDPRASFQWADLRRAELPRGLDFVVTNPPFHDGGTEDQSLGHSFVKRSAEILKAGGRCWLVANRHLPYEENLRAAFASVRLITEEGGYKIYEAIK